MIAVDTSALVAILCVEPDASELLVVLGSNACVIGAPVLVEAHLVLSRDFGGRQQALLMELIERYNIAIVPFGEAEYRLAAEAFDRFGKGSKHPAKLNFGDCLSYAVAKSRGIGLLYKGGDFARTDLKKARRR
jgi:ribonuclease VapC